MTTLPQELMPAHERPVDRDSIDARMASQIAFEDAHPMRSRRERRGNGNKIRKAMAVGTAVLTAAVAVELIGNAMDQNARQYYGGSQSKTTQAHSANKSP